MQFDKKVELTTNLLTDIVNEICFVERKISSLTGSKVEIIKYKFKFVFEKNIGFEIVSKVFQVLEGQKVDIKNRCV